MQGANLLGRWTRSIAEDSDWTLQAYYDWTEIADAVPALVLNGTQFAAAGELHDDLQTLDLDFQHRFPLGSRQRFVWGAAFRNTRDVVSNAPALAFLPARMNHSLYSMFFQDEIRLPRDLSITLGTKLEHGEYTGLEVEPNMRFQWKPGSSRSVWGAVSRAVRTPSRIDRDLRQAAPPNLPLLYGNPDFKSEKLVAYELGYRAQETGSLSTSLSAFYNVYSDVRSTSITPVTILPFYFSNNLEGHTYGFEFMADLQVTANWSLHATYNYLEERLRVKPGEFDLSNARNETSDPQYQASLRSSLNLPGGFELDAALRWVDTLQNNDGLTPGTVSAYMDLNLRIAWNLGDEVELSIAGQNLLHKQHPEYGFAGPGRREAERSVFGKLVWRR
jgi:iron complex outermembrane receptor protein